MERNRREERRKQSEEMKAEHLERHIANVNLLRGVFYHGRYFSDDRLPKKAIILQSQ